MSRGRRRACGAVVLLGVVLLALLLGWRLLPSGDADAAPFRRDHPARLQQFVFGDIRAQHCEGG